MRTPNGLKTAMCLLLVIALAVAGSRVMAANYYVAPPPGGDDGHLGTLASPWATLQHAADSVRPGDVVQVRAGNYTGGYFTTSGTAAQPIVLEAYPGEAPQIVADNPTTPDGINLEGASYMVVQGFTVNGRTRTGIRAVTCSHVTIRNNSMDQNGSWGILTGFCDDLLIENNTTSRSVQQHGIYVGNSGDRPVIRGNLVWGNHDNGIHMNGDISEGGDGIISDAVVEGNIIHDNGVGGGSGINMDGVQDSLICNNLLYNNHASGISLYQIDGGGPSTGNRVLNNTVLVAADGRWALNVQNAATNNTVRNNIFYDNQSSHGSVDISADSLPGFDSDYNVVMNRFTTDDSDTILTLAQWQSATSQDMHSLVSTPAALFVSVANNDYHLLLGSPAIDAGQTLADVTADLEGTPRPQGNAYDIGAYESRPDTIFANGFELP